MTAIDVLSNPPHRPSKFNPKRVKSILRSLQQGNYIETASAIAGICKVTLYAWLKRANEARGQLAKGQEITSEQWRFIGFLNAVEKAQAQSEADDLHLIGEAGRNGAWKANAWRLERRMPGKWGQRQVHTHEGQVEVTVRETVLPELVEVEAERIDDGQ